MSGNRDLNKKIGTLNNMQKVMKAMNMIASVKFRKLVHGFPRLAIFEKQLDQLAARLVGLGETDNHCLLAGNPAAEKSLVVLFTADKGLCGSHNSSAHKALEILAEKKTGASVGFELCCVGNKGLAFAARREYPVAMNNEINDKTFFGPTLGSFESRIAEGYLTGRWSKILFVYNAFESTIHQETRTVQILPMVPQTITVKARPVITGEESKSFLDETARQYLFNRFECALRHSRLSEQASRMTAMENASNNSQDLINRYVTILNRLRQASITNELIEIISGKEALKGN